MLRIDNLHAAIDGKQILNGVSLTGNPAEVRTIMGPNGSQLPIRGRSGLKK